MLVIGDAEFLSTSEDARSAEVSLSSALAVRGQRRAGGVDLDLLWGLIPAIRAIDAGTTSWQMWRYDAVIVVLHTHPTRVRPNRIEQQLLRVLGDLARAAPLLVVAAHHTDDDAVPVGQLRRIVEHVARAHPTAVTVPVELGADRRLHDPVKTADALLHVLDQSPSASAGVTGSVREGPQDEQLRQEAAERSINALGAITADLLRVVLLARNTFDMPYAQINLVSDGRLHNLAYAGRSSDTLTGTLSAMVILNSEALLIEDTRTDSRSTHIEETHGSDAIRFYIGHPIRAADGYRIGTLCVFDTQPHPIDQEDDILIRDLAHLAEAEINALITKA